MLEVVTEVMLDHSIDYLMLLMCKYKNQGFIEQ